MKTKHKMIRVYDPVNKQTWEVPRKQVTSVFAEVSERWVANVIVPEAVVRKLVTPDFLEPVPTGAGYVLSLCAIFMKHAAPEWAPLKMGPASRNCALQVVCRDTRDGTQATWMDHCYSDNVLAEALTKLGFPEVIAKLKVSSERDFYGHRTLQIATADNMLDLQLVEYPDSQRVRGSAFADTQTFEDYFQVGARTYGPTSQPNKATIVDLYQRSDNRFEPMERHFGVLRTAWGNWKVDSVYRTCNGLYEWRYEGDVEW